MYSKPKLALCTLEERVPVDLRGTLRAAPARDLGSTWERLNLSAPGPGERASNLSPANERVTRVRRLDVEPIGVLGGLASEIESLRLGVRAPEPVIPPADLDAYADYVGELANRYRGCIRHWESWHEPNVAASWGGWPDAERYAQLLATQHHALKVADPDAQLLFGATRGIDLPFTRQVLDALQGERAFDAIALRPYRWSGPSPDDHVEVVCEDGVTTAPMTWKEELLAVTNLFVRSGHGAPDVIITECDWSVGEEVELEVECAIGLNFRDHREEAARDVENLERASTILREDPELDFVKTALWFDIGASDAQPRPGGEITLTREFDGGVDLDIRSAT